MKIIAPLIFGLLLAPCLGLYGKAVYVSVSGSNQNPGTFELPFRTIMQGVSEVEAGDTCFIRQGYYAETVLIDGKTGTSLKPVVIRSFENEQVVLDGSMKIGSEWIKHEANIWKTKLSQDIWQLFYNECWMMMARWPNASLEDGTIWDQKGTWVKGDPSYANGSYGMMSVGGSELSENSFHLENALAILNVGSFRTYTREVLEHQKGERIFRYKPVPRSGYRTKQHFAYFEGKLEFLDQENEWFYDRETKTLYAWFPDRKAPEYPVKGKIRTFTLSVSESSNIKILGLNFFASTAQFADCDHITLENCHFNFPTYSKRMLGDTGMIPVTSFTSSGDSVVTAHIIRNCSFTNTDGSALLVQGNQNLMENCLFRNIDISCSEIPGIGVSIMFTGSGNVIRRNTIDTCGCSETLSPGRQSKVMLNRISRTGMLQSDGAMIHCMKPEQPGVEIAYNWCFNSEKYGIRFDGKPASTGGLVHHNVVWDVEGGYQLKGDEHRVYNNVGFGGRQKNDFISLSDVAYGGNTHSIYMNNLGGKISGHRSFSSELHPVPGVYKYNWNGYDAAEKIDAQLRNPGDLDFRPVEGSSVVDAGLLVEGVNDAYCGDSPDIGAYEYGDTSYWIPGRKEKFASSPVPSDRQSLADKHVDLMWLFPYRANSCDVYLGSSEKGIEGAERSSQLFRGNQSLNIFRSEILESGLTYYWRIDGVHDNEIIKGPVWSFTVE